MKSNSGPAYDKELTHKYNSGYRFDHPHQFMAYSTWLEEIGEVKGKSVLDLACGGGTSTRMLSEKGALVTGVDVSSSMLETAELKEKENPVGNKYILADASTPHRYSDEKFDMVAAAFLLHYASSEEVLKRMIENISLNLKPGGRFVTINLSPDHPIISPGKGISHSSKWLGEPFRDGAAVEVKLWSMKDEPICTLTDYYWSRATFEKLLTNAGFKDIRFTEVKMHEEGKKLSHWKELERQNMLVVLSAILN